MVNLFSYSSAVIVRICVDKKKTMRVIVGVVFGLLLFTSTMAENSELQVLHGNSHLTNELYKVLAEQDGNVFFSPISIHAVLSMAYQGALGTTAQRFAETLKVPEASSAAEGYNAVMKRLNSVENVTLLMANKVFVMSGFTFLENFKNAITNQFLSDVQSVDFGQSEAAAKTINDWVEQQTHDKIKDLINKDDLSALTRLVLVNAIYFKGNWKHQFDKKRTHTRPFYLNENDQIEVPMMHMKSKFNYKNDDSLGAQVLELPYSNEDLSMIILLPHTKNGIKELEQKLANINLTDVTQNMLKVDVNVALPKFKIETTIDLKDSLTKVGLGEIFEEGKANFRGILKDSGDLYVSKAVQKAFIEVNEEGAEAAAATALVVAMYSSASLPPPEIYFTADHPFIFLVTHKEATLTSLFMGKITKL